MRLIYTASVTSKPNKRTKQVHRAQDTTQTSSRQDRDRRLSCLLGCRILTSSIRSARCISNPSSSIIASIGTHPLLTFFRAPTSLSNSHLPYQLRAFVVEAGRVDSNTRAVVEVFD